MLSSVFICCQIRCVCWNKRSPTFLWGVFLVLNFMPSLQNRFFDSLLVVVVVHSLIVGLLYYKVFKSSHELCRAMSSRKIIVRSWSSSFCKSRLRSSIVGLAYLI